MKKISVLAILASTLLACNTSEFSSSDVRFSGNNDLKNIKQKNIDVRVDPNDFLEQLITLKLDTELKNKTLTNGGLTEEVKKLNQASTLNKTEIFRQGKEGTLDIALVIDNSGSMDEEQQNLSNKLSLLTSAINNTDWRIGLISTDPVETCVRSVITKNDPNREQKFKDAVLSMGTRGTSTEQGIRQAVTALDCQSANPWLRSDSTVAVLIVSDEDNCSSLDSVQNPRNGCNGQPYANFRFLTDYLENELNKTLGKDASVYGLFKIPGDTSCTTSSSEAFEYQKLVDATGGTSGSICDADYSRTLNEISRSISAKVEDNFALSIGSNTGVDTKNAIVKIDGVTQNGGFRIENNKLFFDRTPPINSEIEVFYPVFSKPELISQIDLIGNPIEDSVVVTVNDTKIPNQDYEVNQNVLKFIKIPAFNSTIIVSYDTIQGITNQITLENNSRIIDIKIDDVLIKDFEFNQSTGQITIDTSLIENAKKLSINYNVSKPKLEYESDILTKKTKDFLILDEITKNPINASIGKKTFVILEKDFKVGKKIIVRNLSKVVEDKIVNLEPTMLEDTLKTFSNNPDCTVGKDIDLNSDNTLTVKCSINSDINIQYDYL